MTPLPPVAASRHAKLSAFLERDPDNVLLLADAADAAIAEGDFAAADAHIATGVKAEGATPAWRFREATLRIAQRRLAEAAALLQELRAGTGANASVDHNLAYVRFLEGDFGGCAQVLRPWLEAGSSPQEPAPAQMAALFLRAMHHLDALEDACAWIDTHLQQLSSPEAMGVASLIALDAGRLDQAGQMAARVLGAQPAQAEAGIAAAGIALLHGDADQAAAVLADVTRRHPHQPRAWSALGFAELARARHGEARTHLTRAVAMAPQDAGSWLGLGWSEVLGLDFASAQTAFEQALQAGADASDAHSGLAAALALQGAKQEAQQSLAQAMQGGETIATRFARAVIEGHASDLAQVHEIAQAMLRRRR